MTDKFIVIKYGYWWLHEIGTARILASGPLPVPDEYDGIEVRYDNYWETK